MKRLAASCASVCLVAGMAMVTLAAASPAMAQQATVAADPALAQSPQPDLIKLLPPEMAKSKTFTVAVSLGSPPDDFRNAEGKIAGWEPDILNAASQLLGLDLVLRPTTFDTLIPGLQAKRFDAAVGQMGITVVREKVIDMVGTLLGNELFAALADSTIKVDSLQDLCGLTVGTTRGSREMVFANDEQPKCKAAGKPPINALAFADGNGAAEALMSKRVQLYWVGSTAISYFVAQSQGRTKVVGHYTDTSYLGVGMPKGSDMAKPLQAAINHLIADGTYAKIVKKWGLEQGAIKHSPINPTNAMQ